MRNFFYFKVTLQVWRIFNLFFISDLLTFFFPFFFEGVGRAVRSMWKKKILPNGTRIAVSYLLSVTETLSKFYACHTFSTGYIYLSEVLLLETL